MGLGEGAQILRNILVRALLTSILNLVQRKESNDALAFGILRDLDWDVEIHHPGQHPTDTVLRIADQPPVFQNLAGSCLPSGILPGWDFPGNLAIASGGLRSRAWLFLRRSAFQD